jgi:hypothetical protein
MSSGRWLGRAYALTGAATLRDLFQDWFDRYDDYQWRVEEALHMRNDVVLVVYLDSGRPGGSTFTVQERGVLVMEWTGGLIVRVTDFDYDEIDDARTAAERLAEERG